MSAGDPGAGAGGVDEDAVKEGEVVPGQLLQLHCVDNRGFFRAQAGDIFLHFFQPVRFRLDRMNAEIVVRGELEQVRGLAAETGAAVEVGGCRPKGTKQAGGKLGSFVLHLEISFQIAGDGGYRPLIVGEDQGIACIIARMCDYLILFEEQPEVVPGDFDTVGSYYQERFPVIGPADPQGFVFTEMFAPSGDQPFRMVDYLSTRLVPMSLVGKGRFLPDRLAEDAVDESLQPLGDAGCFAAFDHLVDRGRWRDPFEEKQLVQSDNNRLVDDGVDFSERGFREQLKDSIEILAVAKNPVDQLHGQIPLVVRQAVTLHGPVEKGFDR